MSNMMMMMVVALAAFVSVGGIAYALFAPALHARSRTTRRIKSIAQDDIRNGLSAGKNTVKQKDRRKELQETLKELEAKQKKADKKVTLQDRIEQAGIELKTSNFYISSVVFGLLLGGIVYLIGYNLMVVGAVTFAGMVGLPRWFISFLANRRQKAFTNEFANAIDIVVRGIKAGLPLNECLQIIANESPDPIGIEFRDLLDNTRMGVPLEDALQRLYKRMPIPELNFFVIVLAIQSKSGGNLSEALSNLSNVLRSRKLMAEKIKAMSSEATASAMIIGSLPPGVTFLIYLTTPQYINTMFDTVTGNALLVIGALWMLTGVFVMKKMVSFKY